MLMESCAGSSVSCTAAIMHGVSRPTDEWDLSCSPVLRSRMLPDFRPELLAVLNSQALMITKSSLSLSLFFFFFVLSCQFRVRRLHLLGGRFGSSLRPGSRDLSAWHADEADVTWAAEIQSEGGCHKKAHGV